ncbi:MAG TPA: HXXEE domain-containing protein [Gemmatimonadaceae bacterium]
MRWRLWFLGLLAVTAILFALSPLALVRARRIVWLAVTFGIINVGNGLLHILAAIRFRRRVPGLVSAPLLLACATWLVVVAARAL